MCGISAIFRFEGDAGADLADLDMHRAQRHRGPDGKGALVIYRHLRGRLCFARFNGMWAIMLIDLNRKILVGSRDRVGIKPFYSALDCTRTLLASECSAIAQVLADGPAIRTTRFLDFLSGYPPRSAGLSFFRGVNQVPAGTWFTAHLRDARVAEQRFRMYSQRLEQRACDTAEAKYSGGRGVDCGRDRSLLNSMLYRETRQPMCRRC
jgi:asparagine synthetase B (glutamine-hydrolysing)